MSIHYSHAMATKFRNTASLVLMSLLVLVMGTSLSTMAPIAKSASATTQSNQGCLDLLGQDMDARNKAIDDSKATSLATAN